MAIGKKLHDLSIVENDTGKFRVFINGQEILGVEKIDIEYLSRGKKMNKIVHLDICVNDVVWEEQEVQDASPTLHD